MDSILIQAAAATMFVKVLVDAVKATPLHTVGWVPVALAFLFGQLCAFLLALATAEGVTLNQRVVSTCVLVGILAAGGAVGVTELQKTAEERKA